MDLSLYLITDSQNLTEDEFFNRINTALLSGVTMVQLREKEKSADFIYQRAIKLKKLCDSFNVPLLINDRVDIAMATDASGVHLGASDLPIFEARKLLGVDKIIGATAKTTESATCAQNNGANYFGIGAFFKTDTKSDALVLTPDMVKTVTSSVTIPAVAIGGIGADNISIISGTGVKGIAVSNAIMRARDIKRTVTDLKKSVLNYI